jgi:hypothetical protein
MYKLLIVVVGLVVTEAAIPVAVILINVPVSPPPMASMASPVNRSNQDLPTPRHFQARDGVSLQYYAYPAEPDKIAVLVHGSARPSE